MTLFLVTIKHINTDELGELQACDIAISLPVIPRHLDPVSK